MKLHARIEARIANCASLPWPKRIWIYSEEYFRDIPIHERAFFSEGCALGYLTEEFRDAHGVPLQQVHYMMTLWVDIFAYIHAKYPKMLVSDKYRLTWFSLGYEYESP
jgi:hypothetical protein